MLKGTIETDTMAFYVEPQDRDVEKLYKDGTLEVFVNWIKFKKPEDEKFPGVPSYAIGRTDDRIRILMEVDPNSAVGDIRIEVDIYDDWTNKILERHREDTIPRIALVSAGWIGGEYTMDELEKTCEEEDNEVLSKH